jgi:hypothetical protein
MPTDRDVRLEAEEMLEAEEAGLKVGIGEFEREMLEAHQILGGTNQQTLKESATAMRERAEAAESVLRRLGWMKKDELARLDADRTAKPLTRIVHHSPHSFGGPLVDPELETIATGERVPLVARVLAPNIVGVIKTAREAFRDDGAEGETVHRLCDAVEHFLDERRNFISSASWREKLLLEDTRRAHAEALARSPRNDQEIAALARVLDAAKMLKG